ncbi:MULTISPECIES: LON peptidase substrate-binding domain-containing protein [unclassified Caulobacter]|uniref:LON peptidase substrate-binding domain-containing protein n=1 Tax=unclassified Caulobacter TaxID=2648921 RepID=UPI000D39528D|nr:MULTISPECIES: LON peptidase substrate-binding domain-containing protein [unclassified Caulobacter]PTS91602.1 peptidase S16 [Caulobacter sp. HMWF009]PTT13060.1 peptidase S16 [Caulobacter sp. HMWF025]
MPGVFRKVSDLPLVIPVFPLNGVLLLPGGQLPLNIFEPRYLNMLDDAMSGERIIGMIQTRGHQGGGEGAGHDPALAPIGCAGRVTSFAETSDGRYLITLTGVCRFRAGDELPVRTPYRQVRADFTSFKADLRDEPPGVVGGAEAAPLLAALRRYLDHRGLAIDWTSAESAPLDALINSLSMALPFDAMEKQALLEAPTLADRRATLVTLLEIDAASGDDDAPASIQ